MGKFLMVVPSNAMPGRDADYNEWYETFHLPEVCAIPGVKSGRRYEAIEGSPAKPDAQYLAIYEIEADDPAAVLAEIGRRSKAGEMKAPTDALDFASAKIMFYKQRV